MFNNKYSFNINFGFISNIIILDNLFSQIYCLKVFYL